MTRPSHAFFPAEITALPEEEWLKVVGEMAFPQRAESMVMAARIAKERQFRVFVETGCIRGWAGDGQSTMILAGLALRSNGICISIDLSQEHIAHAQVWLGELKDSVTWITEDSVSVLSGNWDNGTAQAIDLLYLDSFDYDFVDPLPAQMHDLAEFGAAAGKLSDNALVVIDDANLAGGGKGHLTTKFMLSRGWKVIYDGYQRILSK